MRVLFLTEIVLWKYRAQLSSFELPTALVTEQRQFGESFVVTLERMTGRLERRSSKSPTLEDSVAHHEGNADSYLIAPEPTLFNRDSVLPPLRRGIQNLITSLTQEI
jgi:hypothetical protein